MSIRDTYIISPHQSVNLDDFDPDYSDPSVTKKDAQKQLEANRDRMLELGYLLFAENKHALLIILQAMDAGGKDSTVRRVLTGLNPDGCRVTSFKVPSEEELDHDFLWRIHREVPRRGEIGVFNRSHYEDVLIARVRKLVPESVWSKRYEQINMFEQILAENNVAILKFFLNISKEEQKQRFQARLEMPEKHWKVRPEDFEERKHWDKYMRAYEDVLSTCSTEWAPWFVIPANKKWYRNVIVSEIIIETLESLNMQFPPPPCDISKVTIT
jgi:PPK2 family polyphosphate:nucleotide phosphotransferase